MAMSKSSLSLLAKAISSKNGLTPAEAERFIQKMFEVANDAINEDKQLKVKWLGTFKVTAVKDRESVDVNTGDRIVIEGRDKISFTPDNILKEIINKPFAQFETVVVNDGVDFSDIDEKFAKMEEDTESEPVAPAEDLVAKIENSVVDDTQLEVPQVESSQMGEIQEEVSLANERISEEEQSSKSLPEESIVDDGDSNVSKNFSENVEATAKQEEGVSVATTASLESTPAEPEAPMASVAPNHNEDEEEEEDEDNSNNNHFVIPKYLVAIVCLAFIALLGGMGWFAFNYGKMQAQRDHLATQLEGMKTQVATQAKKATPAPVKVDSTQLALNEKARQDSIRMAAASQAVEKAEESQKNEELERAEAAKASKAEDATKAKTSKTDDSNKATSSHYDNDPRVRTGAYRIVGVAQVVTVKTGQSLAGLSKTYLGPGMECYMEAVNGGSEVKAGQKVKIPKLELKKKR